MGFDEVLKFIKAYIQSMRLYYAFVTGIAGWIGMAFYEYIAKSPFQTVELVPATEKNTLVLLTMTLLITYTYLESIALLPAILGIVLNIIYEYAKGHGVFGNIVFGLMIAMCTAFGFLAAGPTQAPYFTSSRVSVLILVAVMNGLMTFYTYFKDYEGDKAAGKRTIIVSLGIEKSRYLAAISAFLPAGIFALLCVNCNICAIMCDSQTNQRVVINSDLK